MFKVIAEEAMRLMDVPKDIPEDALAVKKPLKPELVMEDASIAGLSERSIMEDDPSLKELLAAQEAEPVEADDAIPSEAPKGPKVPDFRGKSVRNVVEMASAEGIEVTIQGSGVARAQLPAAGRPMHRGERIRVVFAR